MNKQLAALVGVVGLVAVLAAIWWSASTRTGEVAENASRSKEASRQQSEAAFASKSKDVARAEVVAVEGSLEPSATIVEERPDRAEQTRIFGRLVDASRVPIRDAEVVATVMHFDDDPVRSNAAGEFELRIETPRVRREFLLMIAARSFEARYVHIAGSSGQEIDAGEIELAPGGVVSGRAVDANGAPVAGARVVRDRLDASNENRAAQRRRADRMSGMPWPAATSASDGAFELIGLPAERTRLVVTSDGHLATFSDLIDLSETRERSDLVLTLDPLEPEDFVRGVVRDVNDEPKALALVGVVAASFQRRVMTDVEGRFSVSLEERQPVDVFSVDLERETYAERRAVQPGSDVALSLRAMRRIPLVVRDPAGERVMGPSAQLEIDSVGERFELGESSNVVTVLAPPTIFYARVRAPGFVSKCVGPFDGATLQQLEATLAPARATVAAATPVAEPDVTPPPVLLDTPFRGRITVDGVAPDAAWTIDLGEVRTRDAAGALEQLQLDREGRFTWPKPAEGEHRLRARIVGGELDGAVFVDKLHIVAAADEWRRELATARVRIDGPLGASRMLVWLGPGGAWAARPLHSADEVTFFEGEVRIVALPGRSAQNDPPSTWPELASGRAKHGEVLVLRAP